MGDAEFKAWYNNYRLQVRKNANQGIDWPLQEMQLFHQLCHLQLICKAVRHAIVNAPDEDFIEKFFDFFGDIRLAEMSNQILGNQQEVNAVNLH